MYVCTGTLGHAISGRGKWQGNKNDKIVRVLDHS